MNSAFGWSQLFPRRRFLAATTAAFAMPSLTRSAESPSSPRITAGVIGLGGRGGWIAEHVAQHPGFQLTAVADYFPQVAETVGTKLNVPASRRFSGLQGFRRLLESRVDAVFLETPPYFFPEHAQAAVAAGCHVYMAKPVAVDVPGTLAILEAGRRATRQSKVFLVDFQTRTDPFHREALQHVRAGMLGRLGLLASYYHDECFPDPQPGPTVENLLQGLAWVNHTALGGSYIVNCDIHAIDVALWIANDVPVSATGYSARRRPEAHHDSDDCYAINFRFKDGLVMTNHSEHMRNGTPFRSGCQAYGDKAFLEANYGGKTSIRGIEDGYAGGESPNLYAEGMQRNVDAFHRAITANDSTNPTLEPSVNATLATLLGREVARRNTSLTWDQLLRDTTRLQVDLTGLKT